MNSVRKVPCPCCGYLTIEERFDICEICSWEDDGQGDEDAHVDRGGPNRTSLWQARLNFRDFGACDEASRGSVRTPHGDEPRAAWWDAWLDKAKDWPTARQKVVAMQDRLRSLDATAQQVLAPWTAGDFAAGLAIAQAATPRTPLLEVFTDCLGLARDLYCLKGSGAQSPTVRELWDRSWQRTEVETSTMDAAEAAECWRWLMEAAVFGSEVDLAKRALRHIVTIAPERTTFSRAVEVLRLSRR